MGSETYKQGAHWDGKGTRFCVYSEYASSIELCLFDTAGKTEQRRISLEKGKDNLWSTYLDGIKPGQLYGYRADGEHTPEKGLLFNKENILLDPYAYEVLNVGQNQYADSAKLLGRVVDHNFDWEGDTSPNIPWNETIFYEAHAKGLTELNEAVSTDKRGTVAGLSDTHMIKHLKDLGITAIELLPLHAFLNESHLLDKQLDNYWGYNSINFFAPHTPYLKSGQINELKSTIKALHKAGIEIILDVVYNHTAEGGKGGPSLSFRGLDNTTYYRLCDHDKSEYVNETGCGNTVNLAHPQVRKMVLDSLRYWVNEFHVDGFRFDLAVSLGRDPEMFNREGAFFKEIESDPVLSKVKLIAEPWDLGPDGYQLGGFPKGWHEWNDKFRDDLRSFWRGNDSMMRKKAQRVAGSSKQFDHSGRSPLATINSIAVHDGMTLHDLVSYDHKHNAANGEDNRDGHNDNHSCSYGHEGESDNPELNALRLKQKKNMLASLFLSAGTPLLLAGDEFGNSQNGNNNAYCQNNPIGWLNWDKIDDLDRDLLASVKKLIEIRKENPALTHHNFLHGHEQCEDGHKDISWYSPRGTEQEDQDWHDPNVKCFGVVFNNAAIGEVDKSNTPKQLFVVFNAASNEVDFRVPLAISGQKEWTHELDTSKPSDQAKTLNINTEALTIPERSVQVFQLR